MIKIAFTDLDDTLFSSLTKQDNKNELLEVAYLKNGEPVSYFSPKQKSFFELLSMQMDKIIPVTARNIDAFKRVNLSFGSEAILNYGGLILDKNGVIDENWYSVIEPKSRLSSIFLKGLLNKFESHEAIFPRLINDYNLDFYFIIKFKEYNESIANKYFLQLSSLINECKEQKFKLHWNGNNIAVLPDWLDKKHAVSYLKEKYIREYSDFLSIGVGDSYIDQGFMKLCDYCISPTQSQIIQKRR